MTDPNRTMDLATPVDFDEFAHGGDAAPSPVAMARRLLRGRLRVAIVLGCVLAAAGAAIGYNLTVPQYRSVALVEIRPKTEKILYDTEQNRPMQMFDQFVLSQAAYAGSRRVVDLAMEDERWTALGRARTDEEISDFQSHLKVSRQNWTQYIAIEFTHTDPMVAKTAADCVMSAYLKLVEEREDEGGSKRLTTLEVKRAKLHGSLEDLQSRELAITGEVGPGAMNARYTSVSYEISQLESTIQSLRLVIAALESESVDDGPGPKQLTVTELALSHPELGRIVREREFAQSARDQLEARGFGGKSPELRGADAQIARLNAEIEALADALRESRGDTISPAERRAQALEAKRQEMNDAVVTQERLREELKKLAESLNKLRKFDQERSALNEELNMVRWRLEQLTVENSHEVPGRIRHAADAIWPVNPTVDRRYPLAAVGGMGGMGLGFVLVIGFGLAASQMRHMEDVQPAGRRAHFLSLVPEVSASPVTDRAPDGDGTSDFCIHQIRTLLQIRAPDPRRVIALTSASPGSGKTTVGIGLGLSFGASGSRTLLVDCDLVGHGLTSAVPALVCEGVSTSLQATATEGSLDEETLAACRQSQIERVFRGRNSAVGEDRIEELLKRVQAVADGSARIRAAGRAIETLARYRGVNGFAPGARAGVLDVLQGAELNDCVLASGFENVAVLPVGDALPKDAQKLSPTHLKRLAAICAERYDTVIFDTGPVLGSIEASFVSAIADEVLFVVSRGQPRRLANDALQRLEQIGAEVSGIVFNRAARSDVARSNYSSQSISVPAGDA